MLNFELLILGDNGWGDELIFASLMTILVSLSSMFLGLLIAMTLLVLFSSNGRA